MEESSITAELSQIYTDIQTVLDLAKQGLLKSERSHQVLVSAKTQLRVIKGELGEIEQLKIDKTLPVWINKPRHGVFVRESEAKKTFEPIAELVSELLNTLGGSLPKKDIFITENSPYEGRKILRSIFNQASSKILIIDGYIRPEILEVLQLNLADISNLELSFLTQKNNNKFFTTFTSDIIKLTQQYPTHKIELKYYDNLPPHDRYVVIDDSTIFHSGHSLAELGNRASSISKIEGDAYEEIRNHITDLWANANS